ncbi:polyphosphate polymerase domain-containing protein [Plantactinospora sp. S1510]|uniref:Polyphosphate polymerase domain-containing protein n=1 Tax=Plantactinospora alkalitolerans TaxID=2789879 RepID=A0ABS0GRB7_9ACTN|nr:polyphosphate polymerase domain-containing protein [Plantactinospora alkalitolerans]MBF9128528.1 polyphosphate polymerase domain-containing protein [Plantactinospora alkalitolerans]
MRLPFRRRAVPADRPGGGEPPDSDRSTPPASPDPGRSDDHAGHALRGPSTLHAFNRYEIKYLMPSTAVPALRRELASRLDVDSHGLDGGYGVWSVYYDTRDLRFYWEKIEGLRFRRKLRVRHYGDRLTVNDDSTVFVEIKQRVNRVTQKRRVALPYHLARDLCDRRLMVEHEPGQQAFLEEVLDLLCRLDLRPVAMTGYQREAFIGRGAEAGLRVTVDHRVRGRDRDFHLGADAENRLIVPARLAVVELKANERVPYWLTDLAAGLSMSVVRISKYCQSVEAFGRAPRSVFHVCDDDPADAPVSAAARSEA